MIDEADKKIINLVQGDIPVISRPFADLADAIGIPEEDFINKLTRLKSQGIMRRFGATLRHQEAGFNSNAMVAWVVPDDRVEEVGKRLAGFREVTHCYQRMPKKDWPYNLYTMIHGSNRDQCHETAKIMASVTGMNEYTLLFSEKEFKKTSMEYF
jgi:DNA-binding Lrp family transcriptional regulator